MPQTSILMYFYGVDYRMFNIKLSEWICHIVEKEWNETLTKDYNSDEFNENHKTTQKVLHKMKVFRS